MKRNFLIAGNNWTARKSGSWVFIDNGKGLEAKAEAEQVYLHNSFTLMFGATTLTDEQNTSELEHLLQFARLERWPTTGNMAAIKNQISTNHAP